MNTALVKLSPKAESYLVKYNAARRALAACVRVDDVKKIRDANMAVQVYARQAKDTELEDMATDIRLRAERRVGEILIEMKARNELAHGGRKTGADNPAYKHGRAADPAKKGSAAKPTIKQLGLNEDQSQNWQKLARQSEKEFERTVATAKDHTPRKARATSACDYDWSKPNPKDFDDPSEMYGKQADHYCHEAMHLAESLPILAGDVDLKVIQSKIPAVQAVADAWLRAVSRLKSRVKRG